MIRGLLLILDAGGSWAKIAQAQRGVVAVLFLHLLPLMAAALGVEAFAMVRLGEGRTITGNIIPVTVEAAVRFAAAAAILFLLAVFLGAKIAQLLARNFHDTAPYDACFRLLAYTLSPLFLLHFVDALPGVNTWFCFAAGILLSVVVLYAGVPAVLRPDPAKSMGLYLILSVLLMVLAGLVHFLAIQILHDQVNLHFWRDLL
jgi:hypothetical protein